MAISSKSTFFLVILALIGTLISDNNQIRVYADDCSSSVPALISECSKYVQISGPKVQPSSDCCKVVGSVDVPCVCKLVTPAIEKIISMEKVVFVARSCGLTVTPGTKCGSYTIPPKE